VLCQLPQLVFEPELLEFGAGERGDHRILLRAAHLQLLAGVQLLVQLYNPVAAICELEQRLISSTVST